MFITDKIKDTLHENKKKIGLSEAIDDRVIEAAKYIIEENLAELVLVGNEKQLREKCASAGIVSAVEIIDPETSPHKNEFINQYYDLRKHKGINVDKAYEFISNPVFFTAMLVRNSIIDGCVSGNMSPTADVVRAALQIIGVAKGTKFISSCFVIMVPDCPYGDEGTLIYADCGLIPFPTPLKLSEIAIASSKTMKALFNSEPRIAFLSFSTLGSSDNENIANVKEAVSITKKKVPGLLCDGELQVDAALVPRVAKIKAPESPVGGKANILIFPDLNSGNIAYKLTERLAKAHAYGPIIQGLAKPSNDLSRGCSIDDIVNVTAITALQSIKDFYSAD